MKKIIITLLLIVNYLIIYSQNNSALSLSINATGTDANASSLLDIESTNHGILIPRMSSADRVAITTPATSLLVFDTDKGAFYFFNGSNWQNITGHRLFDLDDDTGIELIENNSTNDDMEIYIEGQESLVLKSDHDGSTRIEFVNNNDNISIGENSGESLTSSSNHNTFIGDNAGRNATTGTFNTCVGADSGDAITSSFFNSFYGNQSGTGNTTGNRNVMVGSSAGRNNETGNNNVFVGERSGYNNVDGDLSVAVGYLAGYLDQDSEQNVYLGAWAGFGGSGTSSSTVSKSGNVFIGYQAGKNEMGSDKLIIENSSADAADALIYGQFDSDILTFNADVGIGTESPDAYFEIESPGTAFDPHLKLSQETLGDYTYLRMQSFNIDNNYWGLYSMSEDDGSASSAEMRFFYNEDSTDALVLYGDGDATLAGTLTELSDRRLKKNIVRIENPLDKLSQLSGYKYNWKSKSKSQNKQIGLMAQEVQDVYPELVREDKEGTLSVNYSGFVPLLIESLKEQKVKIEKLEEELIRLKKM